MGRACSVKLERTTIMKVKEKITQKTNQATKMLSVAAPQVKQLSRHISAGQGSMSQMDPHDRKQQ